jgi:hypothetical protein
VTVSNGGCLSITTTGNFKFGNGDCLPYFAGTTFYNQSGGSVTVSTC